MFANPRDRYCLVRILKHYIELHLKPSYALIGKTDGPFFVRRAFEKELKPRALTGCLGEASNKEAGAFGVDYFNKIMKNVAIKCGFDNPEGYSMRSNRRGALSKLASAEGVATSTVEIAGRHKSVTNDNKTNRLYHVENLKQHEARSTAFHIDMSNDEDAPIMTPPKTHGAVSIPEAHAFPSDTVVAPPAVATVAPVASLAVAPAVASTLAPMTYNPMAILQQQQQQQMMMMNPMMGMMNGMNPMAMGMGMNPMMSMMMQQSASTQQYSLHDPRWNKTTGETYEAFCTRLSARGAVFDWRQDPAPF